MFSVALSFECGEDLSMFIGRDNGTKRKIKGRKWRREKLIWQDSGGDKCVQILRWRLDFTRTNSIFSAIRGNKRKGRKKWGRILRQTRHLKWRERKMAVPKLTYLLREVRGKKSIEIKMRCLKVHTE